MALSSLICSETISRVSSVLNREVKQFGKKYMFDGNEETSWNSDQEFNETGDQQTVSLKHQCYIAVSEAAEANLERGATQWLTVEFPQTVQASQIQIQFQGVCELEMHSASFPFKAEPLDKLKITFQNSSDFFGRIIVYHLNILGQKL